MNDYIFGKDILLDDLPVVLAEDESTAALADSIAELLAGRGTEIDRLKIYHNIDVLPEKLLDILAHDFNIGWYDRDWNLDAKRETFRQSWKIRRHFGTKSAIDLALKACFGSGNSEEWFDYDGRPNHYRIVNIKDGAISLEEFLRVLEVVGRKSAVLDSIGYVIEAEEDATIRVGGQVAGLFRICIPEVRDEFMFEDDLHVGGQLSSNITIPMPMIKDSFDYTKEVRMGGRVGAATTISIPELQ